MAVEPRGFHGVGGFVLPDLKDYQAWNTCPHEKWLEDYLPFKMVPFLGNMPSLGGGGGGHLPCSKAFLYLSYLFSPQTTHSLVLRDML